MLKLLLEKQEKYTLSAINKRDGEIYFDVSLDIVGGSKVVWMGMNNDKIFIQSIFVQNIYFYI